MVYPGNSLAKILYENKQEYLFNAEAGAALVGFASWAFELRRERGAFYPFAAAFELYFSGTPGVFQVDIQVADTDLDDHYITVSSFTSTVNNVNRFDMTNLWPKFVRAKVVALANAVNVSVLVTR